jgi:hypothetical protein
MITWPMKPGRLHEALDLFSRIPPEVLSQEPGPGIRLIGRWHDLVRGKGVVICESEDPVAVSNWCLRWNTRLVLRSASCTPPPRLRRSAASSAKPADPASIPLASA